jgi:hypothetical protein
MFTSHQLSDQTRTISQRRCWSVIFNVNGNAPADATVASFATKELAHEALELWAAIKDDDQVPNIIVAGVRYWELPAPFVEGYNFDTYYEVVEDWQEDKHILTSLAQLTSLCGCSEPSDKPDGIVILDDDDSDESDD